MAKRLFLYVLFSASFSAVVGGGLWSCQRIHRASQRVAARHIIGEPPTAVQRIKELTAETIQGGPGVTVGAPGSVFAGIPTDGRATVAVGEWDPRVVAELKQEGIEVGALNEIRSALRDALTAPDPADRIRKLAALRQTYGVTGDPALLARLDGIEAERRGPDSLGDRGRQMVSAFTASVSNLYQGLMKEVNR